MDSKTDHGGHKARGVAQRQDGKATFSPGNFRTRNVRSPFVGAASALLPSLRPRAGLTPSGKQPAVDRGKTGGDHRHAQELFLKQRYAEGTFQNRL